MRVLDDFVEKLDQKTIVLKIIVIDFIILMAFLIPMIVFFDPDDLTLPWIGMTFAQSIFVVPLQFWKSKPKWHTVSIQEFLLLASEKESTERQQSWSRRRIVLSLVLFIAIVIQFLIVPLFLLFSLDEYSGDKFALVTIVTILLWASMMLMSFGFAYESETERTLHFGNDIHNATLIIKSLENRDGVEDLQVKVLIITDSNSVSIFCSHIHFYLPEISEEVTKMVLESFPGEGTSISLKVKGSFNLQKMDDPQEHDIGLDHNASFYLVTEKKGCTIHVWYPKDEDIKKVDDLSEDGYAKLLDLLFQSVDKIGTSLSPNESL